MADGIRLNKYLSEAGVCSRRAADTHIENGKVTINGETAVMGQKVMPGDVVQLSFDGKGWNHSPVVVAVRGRGAPSRPADILVAAHSYDADNRPLNTYPYKAVRFLHFLGVRKA